MSYLLINYNIYSLQTDDNTFTLSFRYKTSENLKATTFFAFTYPYSYAELQIALNTIDLKMLPLPAPQTPDDIYYCRECLIYSLEGKLNRNLIFKFYSYSYLKFYNIFIHYFIGPIMHTSI